MTQSFGLSNKESAELHKIAIALGKMGYWLISDSKVYCLICDQYICEWNGKDQKYVEPKTIHLRKHLKLKVFL